MVYFVYNKKAGAIYATKEEAEYAKKRLTQAGHKNLKIRKG
jgi:hypothetical protein